MLGKTHAAVGAVVGAWIYKYLPIIEPHVSIPANVAKVIPNVILKPITTATPTANVLIAMFTGIVVAMIAAKLPDIDEPLSRVARDFTPVVVFSRRFTLILMALFLLWLGVKGITPLIPSIVLGGWLLFAEFGKHRGFTHSPAGLVVFVVGAMWLNSTVGTYLSMGYVVHLLMDLISDHGISYKWPFEGRFWIPTGLRTGAPEGDIKGQAQVAISRVVEFGIRVVAYVAVVVMLVEQVAGTNVVQVAVQIGKGVGGL